MGQVLDHLLDKKEDTVAPTILAVVIRGLELQ
jgi:hypothetical protein